MSTYRNTDEWCMKTPTAVDRNTVGICSNDKIYRCPQCKKRVKMSMKFNPLSLGHEPVWCWPAHKIRKTKR